MYIFHLSSPFDFHGISWFFHSSNIAWLYLEHRNAYHFFFSQHNMIFQFIGIRETKLFFLLSFFLRRYIKKPLNTCRFLERLDRSANTFFRLKNYRMYSTCTGCTLYWGEYRKKERKYCHNVLFPSRPPLLMMSTLQMITESEGFLPTDCGSRRGRSILLSLEWLVILHISSI